MDQIIKPRRQHIDIIIECRSREAGASGAVRSKSTERSFGGMVAALFSGALSKINPLRFVLRHL
jgi:hypothetical protein